jgi:hypothetical protein
MHIDIWLSFDLNRDPVSTESEVAQHTLQVSTASDT